MIWALAKRTVRVHRPTGEQGGELDPDGAVGLRRVTAVGGRRVCSESFRKGTSCTVNMARKGGGL